MRLNELSPGKTVPMPSQDMDLQTIFAKYIKPTCSRSLYEMKKANGLLYRGMTPRAPVFAGKSRNDRMARDSIQQYITITDKMLASQGFIALRSNSIFVTGDLEMAKAYGDGLYAIFPMNGFQYTYSNYLDLVITSWVDIIPLKLKKYLINEIQNKIHRLTTLVDFFLKNNIDYDNVDESLAFLKKSFPEDALIQSLTPDNIYDPKGFVDYYKFKKDNMAYAIQHGNEIYIHGRYFAIDVNKYSNSLIHSLATS